MKKFTWGHGIVLALAAFIIFILSMIFFFSRGWQNAEMVSEDYYADELAYQQTIDAKQRADQLTEKPEYYQDRNGIKITFPPSVNNNSAKVRFDLFRTDDQRLDVKKDIKLDAQNAIVIPAKILAPGNYTLKLHWNTGGKDYQIDYDVLWKQP